MSTRLNEHYEKKVRPHIDLTDSLHALGVETDLKLPAIVVIGDQSSGKSSVLEALSGVPLPCGSGMVTRCPLKLKMKKSKNERSHGKISYKDIKEEIQNSTDVDKIIRKAQNEIAGAVDISHELISLEVTSPNVPDLTLIDLPGIAHVPMKGQREDIREQSKSLIRKFITNQDTIILVVMPCNLDIATTEALKMAQEVDPHGTRTLVILTKADLVDRDMEETVMSNINNKLLSLKKGYMIVRYRGQQEINKNIPLHEAVEKEKDFFINHPHFRTLYNEGKATIPNLAEKLTLNLVDHIKQSLPQIDEQIQIKLVETQEAIDRYGLECPTDPTDKMIFLTDKITAFIQDAISLTTGEELKSLRHVNIFSRLRKHFDEWKKELDTSGMKFKEVIDEELQLYEKKYRGRELPGFINYNTFEMMFRTRIKQLEEPAVLKMREISDFIMEEFIQLAEASFLKFPNLLKITRNKIIKIKKKKELEAESMLRTQFKMELMIYTQDSIYSEILKMLKEKLQEDERKAHGVPRSHSYCMYNLSDIEDALEELTTNLMAYYSIVNRRLADQVPLVIRYMVLQESAAQLQREMIQLTRDNDVNFLLEEIDDNKIKLDNLKRLQNSLKEALKKRD
ncbi:interferon-induced GTP-binding protein Mx1-like [Clarias gariepinus]|uniref:interferon-induced GTP-binding protein Mx1-like n=1 Tax=Clarias gariepinus TaxID=13013 RepID=UPI00234C72B6|nr:interferon-induced GTP-binding protein Mx1-like [Clarias gariepinus]